VAALACLALACLVCLFAPAGLLGASPSAAATAAPAPWSKPAFVGEGGEEPEVVLTGEGGAAAVWGADVDDGLVVEGAVRVGGQWKPAAQLATEALEPSVAASAEGAIAVWAGPHGIEAARTTPAGAWKPLPTIPHTSRETRAPEIATDAAGRATVVWRQPGPAHATIDVATRTPGGSWSAPKRLSRPGGVAYSPHVAVDPDGAAAVVWRRYDGERSIVQAATRTARGRWSAAANLSAKGENAVAPDVAIDPAGEAVAVWHRFDGAHQIVQVSVRPPHGGWSRPVDLSAKGRNGEQPQVALTPAGEAVVTWARFDGRVERIQAVTRSPGGHWSSPRNLSGAGGSSHEPKLAIDGEGVARVVWEATVRDGVAVEEASRPAGGGWSAPLRLGGGTSGFGTEPTIAAAPDGEAVALWNGEGLLAAFRAAPPAP
jgi:hypothetical protein